MVFVSKRVFMAYIPSEPLLRLHLCKDGEMIRSKP